MSSQFSLTNHLLPDWKIAGQYHAIQEIQNIIAVVSYFELFLVAAFSSCDYWL